MIPRDDNGQLAALERRAANMRKMREQQARIAEMEFWEGVMDREVEGLRTRIAELEAAIDKLAQCKGRFHPEANFKALIEVRNKSLHK